MQNLRKEVGLIAIGLILVSALALNIGRVSAADPVMEVVPSTIATIVGKSFTVYINVTDVTNLYGWEFQLDYNKSKLDLTYADIVTGGLNTPTNTFKNLTDETNGRLWWAVSTVYPGTGINYSSHAIFEIRFTALATGTSSLHLHDTILSDSNANAITHTTADGTVNVETLDLKVDAIKICNMYANETWPHSIYANDTYSDAVTPYYYPVNVTIENTGTLSAGSFNVTLEVYYDAGLVASGKLNVAGLGGSSSKELTFSSVFHPTKTGDAGRYSLKATVDSDNDVVEDDEANNVMTKNDFMVTVMGDVNGDKKVNILDGVKISLAWSGTPGSTQWNDAADLNHDNAVNLLDGSRISLHWGESW